jgi:hypothetical protein
VPLEQSTPPHSLCRRNQTSVTTTTLPLTLPRCHYHRHQAAADAMPPKLLPTPPRCHLHRRAVAKLPKLLYRCQAGTTAATATTIALSRHRNCRRHCTVADAKLLPPKCCHHRQCRRATRNTNKQLHEGPTKPTEDCWLFWEIVGYLIFKKILISF